MNNVKWLGTTDEVTTCECCGRADLKNTVALSIDDGDAVYFGVTCAAIALSRPVKEVRSESRKADRARERVEADRRAAADRARSAPWFAFLTIYTTARDFAGRLDVFKAIESLGGYEAARAKFEEHKNEPGIAGAGGQ